MGFSFSDPPLCNWHKYVDINIWEQPGISIPSLFCKASLQLTTLIWGKELTIRNKNI